MGDQFYSDRLKQEMKGACLTEGRKLSIKQAMLVQLEKQKEPSSGLFAALLRFWNTTYEIPVPVAALCLAAILLVPGLSLRAITQVPPNSPIETPSMYVEYVQPGGAPISTTDTGR